VASKKKIVVWNYETMTVVTKLKLNLESGSKSSNLTSSNLLQLFLPHNCVEGGEIFAVSAGKKNLRPLLRVQLTGDAASNSSVIFRHVTLATQHVGDTGNTLVSLSDHKAGLEKTRFFLKKPSPVVFWVFFDFLGFFLYICPEERVFRVFSASRILSFRCIQTLDYNHSYLLTSFS
jgi:hypothetical protein